MSARHLCLCLCLVAGGVHQAVHAHGGTYRGPADALPPGSAPGTGPSTPTGVGPAAAPGQPGSVGAGAVPAAPVSAAAAEPDSSVWQLWWGYNHADYVDIKGAIHSSDLLGGSAAFFLGRRPRGGANDRIIPTREVVEQRVVPALLRVLAEERDADMVTGALIALAKIGEVPGQRVGTSARISMFLADANQEIAETAAISLGILADPYSVSLLTDLVLDRPAGRLLLQKGEVPLRTRAFAAYGLGLIGNRVEDELLREAIVKALSEALSSGGILDLATPDVAVACLSSLGLVPLSTTVPAAGVAETGRMRQIDWLLDFAEREDLDLHVRAHLPTAVARLVRGAPPSWGLQRRVCGAWIEDLAADSEVQRTVQQSAVLALGRVAQPGQDPIDRAVRAALLEASQDSRNVEVRRFALIALAQIGSRADEGDVAQEVASEIREHLITRLEEGAGGVQAWAALALGVLGRGAPKVATETEQRTDGLIVGALAQARAPRDVGACAIACGMRRQSTANAALLRKLDQVSDDEARGYVSLALGMTGAVEALEPIHEIVRRSKYRPELLRQAAISLGLLGDKDVVPELIAILERATSLSAQASIAYGLGAIGDARSIDPLIEMLHDAEKTPRARAFAAVALGIVSDKEPRPWNAKLSVGVNYRANTTTLTDGRGAGILEIL